LLASSVSANFDQNWIQPFEVSPFWLRFELGGEAFGNLEQPVPRFIRAFSRARSIADRALAQSAAMTAIVGTWPPPEHDTPQSDYFIALDHIGFRAPDPVSVWSAPVARGEPDILLSWQALAIDDPMMRDTLLWTSIANEMPVTPKAAVIVYFVDFVAGVMLHAYDDRGMDVIALERAAIEPMYRDFDDWLLDHDRPRMAAAFAIS
jgi:hypothetical protein